MDCLSIQATAASKVGDHPTTQNKGTILIVDDDANILFIRSNFFQRKGFAVLTASNSLEAIQQFNKLPHLVIMDLDLPGDLNGLEIAKQMKKLHPEVPIILSSGDLTEFENEVNIAMNNRIINAVVPKRGDDFDALLTQAQELLNPKT